MPPAARSSGLASGSTPRGSCTVLLYDSQKGRLQDHNWPLTWVRSSRLGLTWANVARVEG